MQVANEIALLSLAQGHPNILHLHGWFWGCATCMSAGARSSKASGDGAGGCTCGGACGAQASEGGAAGAAVGAGAVQCGGTLCLLLEHCEGGTLGKVLKVSGCDDVVRCTRWNADTVSY